jgi:hypothetical protein
MVILYSGKYGTLKPEQGIMAKLLKLITDVTS